MLHKIPPAKILVNRAVELEKLRHPREVFAYRLNVATAFLSLAGLAAWKTLIPSIVQAKK